MDHTSVPIYIARESPVYSHTGINIYRGRPQNLMQKVQETHISGWRENCPDYLVRLEIIYILLNILHPAQIHSGSDNFQSFLTLSHCGSRLLDFRIKNCANTVRIAVAAAVL